MVIKAKASISISEAAQDFSGVTRLADENGAVVILENDAPKYVLIKCKDPATREYASDKEVAALSKRLIEQYRTDFEKLAK